MKTDHRIMPRVLCITLLTLCLLLTGCGRETAPEAAATSKETDAPVKSAVAALPSAEPTPMPTVPPTDPPSVTPPAAFPADAASESDIHLVTELPASETDIFAPPPASDSDLAR